MKAKEWDKAVCRIFDLIGRSRRTALSSPHAGDFQLKTCIPAWVTLSVTGIRRMPVRGARYGLKGMSRLFVSI